MSWLLPGFIFLHLHQFRFHSSLEDNNINRLHGQQAGSVSYMLANKKSIYFPFISLKWIDMENIVYNFCLESRPHCQRQTLASCRQCLVSGVQGNLPCVDDEWRFSQARTTSQYLVVRASTYISLFSLGVGGNSPGTAVNLSIHVFYFSVYNASQPSARNNSAGQSVPSNRMCDTMLTCSLMHII